MYTLPILQKLSPVTLTPEISKPFFDSTQNPKTPKQHEIHHHPLRPRGALRLHGRRRRQSELDDSIRLLVSIHPFQ